MGKAQHQPGLIGMGDRCRVSDHRPQLRQSRIAFAAVATVERSTARQRMEQLGGCNRPLPAAFIVSSIGAAALAALPPFSGFVSEWLGLQDLMQGFGSAGRLASRDRRFGRGRCPDRGAGGARVRASARDDVPRHAPRPVDRAGRGDRSGADWHGHPRRGVAGDRRRRAVGRQGVRTGDGADWWKRRHRPHQPARLGDRARLPQSPASARRCWS